MISRVRLEECLKKKKKIYAELSNTENFFEKFIARDLKNAPKK